jgi:cytochrome c
MARFLKLMSIAALFVTATTTSWAADSAKGRAYFQSQCSICHGNTATSPPGVGPRLFGVVGRRSGSLPGYAYSPAMRQSGLTWSSDQIKRYLTNPQATVRGNKMPFPGVPSSSDAENVVAYLNTLH